MKNLPPHEPDPVRLRGLEADHLQEIESNPITAEERAMFDRFQREGWSPEQQRAFILAQFKAGNGKHAAE
jgi:hypothetical protein